jgi:hypothetical protein
MAIEEPKFSLALKDGAFELRDYAASVVAEVSVTGNHDEAGRRGFGLLAGYIFGANTARQKIAMTAPVTRLPKGETIPMTAPVTQTAAKATGGGEWLVRFTMPARYRLEDLPLPSDPAVSLHDQPPARLAVLRFSGLSGDAKVADATDRLLAWVAARRMVAVGPSQLARYDPPWTPWFLRRNEVMVPVAPA